MLNRLLFWPVPNLNLTSLFIGSSKLSDEVFGTSGDSVNLVSQYKECSNNKFELGPTSFSGIADGVTSVSVSLSDTSHSTRSQRIAYENAITAELNRIVSEWMKQRKCPRHNRSLTDSMF